MNIIKNIERLAEINCANSIIEISDELRNERSSIVSELVDLKVIKLNNEFDKGGFSFIGETSINHKQIYMETFLNF